MKSAGIEEKVASFFVNLWSRCTVCWSFVLCFPFPIPHPPSRDPSYYNHCVCSHDIALPGRVCALYGQVCKSCERSGHWTGERGCRAKREEAFFKPRMWPHLLMARDKCGRNPKKERRLTGIGRALWLRRGAVCDLLYRNYTNNRKIT